MRLLIVGRAFPTTRLWKTLDQIHAATPITVVCSGGPLLSRQLHDAIMAWLQKNNVPSFSLYSTYINGPAVAPPEYNFTLLHHTTPDMILILGAGALQRDMLQKAKTFVSEAPKREYMHVV